MRESILNKRGYKLLVLDIDGTLVNGSGRVSPRDKEVLDRVRDAGIRIALSTGRAYRGCTRILDTLGLDSYHIFFDGALVGNHDLSEEICAMPLDKKLVKEVVDVAGELRIDLELFSATEYFAGRETWSTGVHRSFFAVNARIVDFPSLYETERIIKGGLVTLDAEEEKKTAALQQRFEGKLEFSRARTPAYPGVTFNNILAPLVSKGKALEVLAAHLGLSLGEVMAVGDGGNDISLVRTAGLGVAMGNATEELKEVADFVTSDIDDGGLAAAIERFLL